MGLYRARLVAVQVGSVSAYEACNTFGVNLLTGHSKDSLFASGCPLLLLSNHNVDFFGFDILADVPRC
jgi:hypothetical protein